MRRSAAVIALVAFAAIVCGGLAQGDGARDEPLARDVEASDIEASALGGAPHETRWSNGGAYWEGGEDRPPAADGDVSSSDVYDAVVALGAVPYRQCFVVVKDGAIAHESYDERRGVDAETPLRTDSVGIIATVALVGAATQRGLFRLDQPIMGYGVRGMQEHFGAYAGLVTAHHLLTQTHGGGEVPPGETFRRDDDPKFLATLFELIEKTSGTSVRDFARVALVEPLGLSHGSLFGDDGADDDSGDDAAPSAALDFDTAYGRNLRLTCRDVATIAQLFLNGGVWRDAAPPRARRQIISARFAREAFSPRVHFPRLNRAFGLGAWAHDPEPSFEPSIGSGSSEACCAPVTGMHACGESAAPLLGPLLGDPRRGGPAERVGVFLGDEGSAVFVLPEANTALVSLGRTVAGSDACPVGLERAIAGVGVGGSLGGAGPLGGASPESLTISKPRRDDYALLKVLWGAVQPATRGGDGYAARTGLAERDEGARAIDGRSSLKPDASDADVRSSGSVRDLVASAFRDAFARAGGSAGTLGGAGGDPARDPEAYVPGVGSGAFGVPRRSDSGVGEDRVDAEVRRLTAARARWYADAEVKLTAEDRERRADYDAKLDALEKTRKKYKAAYEQAKLEIVAAAKEEKRAEARERDADAARWQASAVLAQQKAQQERLDRREREVNLAQAEYAEALAEARAARSAARGAADEAPRAEPREKHTRRVRDASTEAEVARTETAAKTSGRSSSSFDGNDGNDGNDANDANDARRETIAEDPEAATTKRSNDAVAPVFSRIDANDFDVEASGGRFDDDDASSRRARRAANADEADETVSSSVHVTRRRRRSTRRGSVVRGGEAETEARAAKTRPSQTPEPPVSLAGAGDVRAVLPASDATAASADDFLSALSPSSKARVAARLGALRALDAALERTLDDDAVGGSKGPDASGAARAAAATPSKTPSSAREVSDASPRAPPKRIASLGTSVWDFVETIFGRPAAREAPVTVGSCLCACPGGGGAADACFDVDLAVAADADGPAACARLALGADADVCAATGVVRRCEEPGSDHGRGVDQTEPEPRKKHVSSSSSSSKTSKTSKTRSKKVSKRTGALGAVSDAPLRSGVLGSVQTVGAYACVKTAQCPADAVLGDETPRDGPNAFSFLVEAYECDAVSFARCRWAPSTRCPARKGGLALGASKVPGTADGGASAPRRARASATSRRRGVAARLASFAFGAMAAMAAMAAAKSGWSPSRREARAATRDEEAAVPANVHESVSSRATAGRAARAPARRGFGVDPEALTRGVWKALGGREAPAVGEREPLLAEHDSVTGHRAPPTPASRETAEAVRSEPTASPVAPTRARRKVVFDVDASTAGGAADGERDAAPLDADADPEARAVAAAERAAAAARAARLARAAKARDDAERRAARAKRASRFSAGAEREARAVPVSELSREELLERAHGGLPRRANAASGTGIPGDA